MTQEEKDELSRIDINKMIYDDSSMRLMELDYVIDKGDHDQIMQSYHYIRGYIDGRKRTCLLLKKLPDESPEYISTIITKAAIPFFWNCVDEFIRAVTMEEAMLSILKSRIDELIK